MEPEDDVFTASDFYDTVETTVTDDAPFDEGQGEVTDEGDDGYDADGTEQAPITNYFDPTEVADKLVRVKVDGEEVEVPVAELLQGYSRQADYTRKTQALAQEREQIAFWQQVDQAMRVNPQMTLDYLSKTYGITEAQARAEVGNSGDDWEFDEDPVRKELRELRELVKPALEYTQVQQAERQLQQVVAGLSAKYGDDFNPNEVINEALTRNIHDPSMLESVFQSMMFNRYRAQATAQTMSQQQTATADAARRQQAAAAAAVVGNGGSARGAVAAQPRSRPLTAREAVEMAFAELDS